MWLRCGQLFFLFVQLAFAADLCPVSTSPQHAKHGNLHYPLEVFFPSVYDKRKLSCVHDFELQRSNSCPLCSAGCPLIEENFRDAVSVSTWKKSTSLCTLKQVLSDENRTSRLIVLGGSVTAGVEGVGCCNKRECFHEPCRRCSWVHQLEHWLRSSYKANVNVNNLGNPGTTSVFSSRTLGSIMWDKQLFNFTSRDVIFIDHSFNDNTLSVPIECVRLEQGLEALIRGIILMSLSLDDFPHIILMVSDTRLVGNPQDRYTVRYQRLALHYGLRYYSYADAILTDVSRTKQKVYHNYLTEKD